MKPNSEQVARLVAPVRAFADHVLSLNQSCVGNDIPLLATYWEARTRQPLRIPAGGDGKGGDMILSNLANQLNFLRVLQGLSALTGDARYRDRAVDIARYVLAHGRRRGMLLWGNHAALDILTQRAVFLSVKGKVHELKAHYPPYDLFWEADPAALESTIAYYWHGHMYDWARLDFSRHGRMDLPDYILPPEPWDADYAGGDPFFIGGGLTFLNAGSDLYYAAATLSRLKKDPRPLRWAERLLRRYEQTRDLRTGMGGYVYSSIFDKTDPAKARSADRALYQFKEQFPEHNPLEGTFTDAGRMRMIIGQSALCRLHLAGTLPAGGEPFGRTAAADVEAYARAAYDFEDNSFHPTFTDGFRLTGQVIQKDGYYGPAGRRFAARAGDGLLFWSHVAAWRFSRVPLLWDVARNIGLHGGLGDIGATPGAAPDIRLAAHPLSTEYCFGLLELDAEFPGAPYRDAAVTAALDFIGRQEPDGWFAGGNPEVLGIDRTEPLAILHVAARMAGRPDAVPPFFTNSALDVFGGWIREQ